MLQQKIYNKIYLHIIILLHITNTYKCTDKKIKCYQHGFGGSIYNAKIDDCPANPGCMIEFCFVEDGKGRRCRGDNNKIIPCMSKRRGCYSDKYPIDEPCVSDKNDTSYFLKDSRKVCNETDLCNGDSINRIKCITKYYPNNNDKEKEPKTCHGGCVISNCFKGKKTDRLHYGCYSYELCRCEDEDCDKECSGGHTCAFHCFDKLCNDKTLPTTTGTTVNITTTTNKTAMSVTTKAIKMTTTNNATILTHQIVQNGIINGWAHGNAGPFELTKMLPEYCGKTERNQISLDMVMKICVREDAKCTGGLTLCYRSQMSGIQNLDLGKVSRVINRTATFKLDDYADEENPIDELCNKKDLWKEWAELKKHGFNLSSDGESVEIQISYDHRISMSKLNANGCVVLHFDRNRPTAGKQGTIWFLKDSDETENNEEEGEETSTSVVNSSPTTTTLTTAADNATARNFSSNGTETAQTEQQQQEKTEQEQTEETSTDAEQQHSLTDEGPDIEQADTSIDKHFWSKLQGGVPLRSFDPLVGLAFDVLVGVGHDKPKLFAVNQDQKDGQCQMRVSFHDQCVDDCLTTTNLDDTLAGTDTD